jgi:hypothetical protein
MRNALFVVKLSAVLMALAASNVEASDEYCGAMKVAPMTPGCLMHYLGDEPYPIAGTVYVNGSTCPTSIKLPSGNISYRTSQVPRNARLDKIVNGWCRLSGSGYEFNPSTRTVRPANSMRNNIAI